MGETETVKASIAQDVAVEDIFGANLPPQVKAPESLEDTARQDDADTGADTEEDNNVVAIAAEESSNAEEVGEERGDTAESEYDADTGAETDTTAKILAQNEAMLATIRDMSSRLHHLETNRFEPDIPADDYTRIPGYGGEMPETDPDASLTVRDYMRLETEREKRRTQQEARQAAQSRKIEAEKRAKEAEVAQWMRGRPSFRDVNKYVTAAQSAGETTLWQRDVERVRDSNTAAWYLVAENELLRKRLAKTGKSDNTNPKRKGSPPTHHQKGARTRGGESRDSARQSGGFMGPRDPARILGGPIG